MKEGFLRIPYTAKKYDEKAVIKSRYSEREINYSPFIVDIVLPEEVTVEHLSEMYEKFLKEKDLAFVYQMVGELISLLNRYTAKEFKRDKDKEEYRYRGDWDSKNI